MLPRQPTGLGSEDFLCGWNSNPAFRSPALRLASGKASKTVPKDCFSRTASHQPARFGLRAYIQFMASSSSRKTNGVSSASAGP